MTTAAITNYLIERKADGTVNLCESQGGQWITIRLNISTITAERFGFNLEAPAVQEVFA